MGVWGESYSDRIWETDHLARKTKFIFIVLLQFSLSEDIIAKLGVYLTLTPGGRRASFPLASSCLNDYFRAYTIIDFLAKQLVS